MQNCGANHFEPVVSKNYGLFVQTTQSIVFVRKHKGFAIALGAIFTPLFHYLHNFLQSIETHDWVFYVILFVSVIIISFVPIFSMVAATIGINQLIDLKSNPYAKSSDNIND